MRSIACIALLIGVACSGGGDCPRADPSELIGQWRSTDTEGTIAGLPVRGDVDMLIGPGTVQLRFPTDGGEMATVRYRVD